MADVTLTAVLEGVDRVESGLETLRQKIDKLSESNARVAQSSNDISKATQQQTSDTEKLQNKLDALLGSLNPVYKAYNDGKTAIETLDKAYQANLLSLEAYEGALEEVGKKTQQHIKDAQDASSSHMQLGTSTGFVTRELRALFDELAGGRSHQAMGTLANLGTHLLNIGFAGIAVVGTVAAVIGAIIELAVHAEETQRALNEMGAQLEATSRSSIATEADLRSYINQLASLPGVSREAATQVVAAYTTAGSIGSGVFQELIALTADYATATGQQIPAAGQQLAASFSDVEKGAHALNDRLNFLSVTQMRTIEDFARQGDLMAAQNVLLDALREKIHGLHEQSMTPLQRALEELSKAWIKATSDASAAGGAFQQINSGFANLVSKIANLIDYVNSDGFRKLNDFLAKYGGLLNPFGGAGFFMLSSAQAASAPDKPPVTTGQSSVRAVDNELYLQALRKEVDAVNQATAAYDGFNGQMRELNNRRIALTNAMEDAKKLGDTKAVEVFSQRLDELNRQQERLTSNLPVLSADAQAEFDTYKTIVTRALDDLDKQYKQNLVGYSSYYEQRKNLQIALVAAEENLLNREIDIAKREEQLAGPVGSAARNAANARRIALEQRLGSLQGQPDQLEQQASFDTSQAGLSLDDLVLRAKAQLASGRTGQADPVEGTVDRLVATYRVALDKLFAEGRYADMQIIGQIFNVELAKANLTVIDKEYQTTLRNLSDAEKRIDLDVKTGLMSQLDGQYKTIEVRKTAITQLEGEIARLKDQKDETEQGKVKLAEYTKQLDALRVSVAQLNNTTDFFSGLDYGFQQFISQSEAPGLIGQSIAKATSSSLEKELFNLFSHRSFSINAIGNAVADSIYHALAGAAASEIIKAVRDIFSSAFKDIFGVDFKTFMKSAWNDIFGDKSLYDIIKQGFKSVYDFVSNLDWAGIFNGIFGSGSGGSTISSAGSLLSQAADALSGDGGGGGGGGAISTAGSVASIGSAAAKAINAATGGSSSGAASSSAAAAAAQADDLNVAFGGQTAAQSAATSASTSEAAMSLDDGVGAANAAAGTVDAGTVTAGTGSIAEVAVTPSASVPAAAPALTDMATIDLGAPAVPATVGEAAGGATASTAGGSAAAAGGVEAGTAATVGGVAAGALIFADAAGLFGDSDSPIFDALGMGMDPVDIYQQLVTAYGKENADRIVAGYQSDPNVRSRPFYLPGGGMHLAVKQATGTDTIVTAPTLMLTGEAGPERVTVSPLGGAARVGMGQPQVVFQGMNIIDEYSMRRFRQKIMPK